MNALPISAGHATVPVVPGCLSNIATLCGREFRDAVRSRWFLLYTLAFVVLGVAVSYVSAAGSGGSGLSGFGRTTAGLINLVLLIVPLMGLNAGASSIASDRERGMLAYLFAQPVTRGEVLVGKYLGLAAALLACICLGLGGSAAILAIEGQRTSPASILWLCALSFALALGMLSLGVLISTLCRRASVAVGTAIFVWLTLVFVSDLGLMAGAVAMRLRIETLFAIALVNPVQVFKMWSLHAVDASLDVLGPAGLYATDEFGRGLHAIFGACMAAWIVLPLTLAAIIIKRRSPL